VASRCASSVMMVGATDEIRATEKEGADRA